MRIHEAADKCADIGCGFIGILAVVFLLSGVLWAGLPILFFGGLVMFFVIFMVFGAIEWVAKLFGYDPDKKSVEQVEADIILEDIKADVARREHVRLLHESDMRAQVRERESSAWEPQCAVQDPYEERDSCEHQDLWGV